MKRTFISGLGILLLLTGSCIFNPPNNGDNNNPNDTIIGWGRAGINSTGDSSQHVDVCHYGGILFTFNYKGELFRGTYPELLWNKINVPDGNKAYDLFCDTINGMLYLATRFNCAVYEYNINTEKWRSFVPKNNPWFDSTKLLDGEMYTRMYSIVVYNNKVFIMTAQGWKDSVGKTWYLPTIWCSDRDTLWVKADSGWYNVNGNSDQVTGFYSIDNFLYAATFEHGLWRYDGVSWTVIPGTRPEDMWEVSQNGGDMDSIPGFKIRSMVKHKGELYLGCLEGMVHKMLPGYGWDRVGMFYLDYNANTVLKFWSKTMSLFSYNGYLIKATYYYNDSADLWYNMTPRFNAFAERF